MRTLSFHVPRCRRQAFPSSWLPGAVALVLALVLSACNLGTPTSPNDASELTGQNPNSTPSFSGTIVLTGGGEAPANDTTDFLVTATVNDSAGRPVQNGTLINFSTTLGTVRAFGADPATAGSSAQLVLFNGVATVAVRSAVPGTAVVSAWIADVAAGVNVRFTEDPLQLPRMSCDLDHQYSHDVGESI